MTTFTNIDFDALIDNVLTEATVRADVAAAFANNDLVLTNVSTFTPSTTVADNTDELSYCDMLVSMM